MGENKICAYSYWGYLGDIKYTKNGEVASTPDGNAFYSWSIIRELLKRRYTVRQVMPNRDEPGAKDGIYQFQSWLPWERFEAYDKMVKADLDRWHADIRMIGPHRTPNEVYGFLMNRVRDYLDVVLSDVEFVLHEWRMKIPGRNDMLSCMNEDWQPDLLIQECLVKYCREKNIKLFIFDLDYKIDDVAKIGGDNVTVLELGTFWEDVPNVSSIGVYIPFDFDKIDYFDVNMCFKSYMNRPYDLVYVGNRYERDWCIDKYIPHNVNSIIHGNWLEGERDSASRWSYLNFGKRLQTKDMPVTYQSAICTLLLAKESYCKYHFMTARIIESIFYGTVPLFIEEYGEETIKEYAGDYASFLTVHSAEEVVGKIQYLRNNPEWGSIVIRYLRGYLRKMDVTNFVDVLEGKEYGV